jgi:Domain of unknown function DUF302.
MHVYSRCLLWVFLCFGLFSALPARAEEEDPLLSVFLEGGNIEQATESLIQAINSNNFSFIRQQAIDSRLVPAGLEAGSARIVYFCNFDLMSRALAIDTRTTEFLPCRITLIETDKGVELSAVNPAWVSNRLGNHRLHEYCVKMKKDYLNIMSEAALW